MVITNNGILCSIFNIKVDIMLRGFSAHAEALAVERPEDSGLLSFSKPLNF